MCCAGLHSDSNIKSGEWEKGTPKLLVCVQEVLICTHIPKGGGLGPFIPTPIYPGGPLHQGETITLVPSSHVYFYHYGLGCEKVTYLTLKMIGFIGHCKRPCLVSKNFYDVQIEYCAMHLQDIFLYEID